MSWNLGRNQPNHFDILRLFFAILVIFSHSFALLGIGSAEPIFRLTHGAVDGGTLAVDGFFAISGLMITESYRHSEGLAVYLRRRILRIYPAFLWVALLCVVIGGPLSRPDGFHYLSQIAPRSLLRSAAPLYFDLPLFPHNPFPNTINGSLWTISYEFQCYLFIAILGVVGLLRTERRRLIVPILFAVAWAVHAISDQQWPRILCYFLAGSTFCLFRDRIPNDRRLFLLSAFAVLIAAILGRGWEIVLPVAGIYILFYVALLSLPGLPPWVKRQNDISYGRYLYAFPVQQLLVYYLPDRLGPYTLFLLATAITLPLAIMSWFTVERPALRLKTFVLPPKPFSQTNLSRASKWLLLHLPLLIVGVLGLVALTDHYFAYPIARFVEGHLLHHPLSPGASNALLLALLPLTLWSAFCVQNGLKGLPPANAGQAGRVARFRWLVGAAPMALVVIVAMATTLLSIAHGFEAALGGLRR